MLLWRILNICLIQQVIIKFILTQKISQITIKDLSLLLPSPGYSNNNDLYSYP